MVGLCSSCGGAPGGVGVVSFGGCWGCSPGFGAGVGHFGSFQLKLSGSRFRRFLFRRLLRSRGLLFRGRRRILRFLIRRGVLRRGQQRQPQNQCQGGSSQPIQLPSKSRHTQFHLFQEKAIPPSHTRKLRQSDAGIPPGVGRKYFCTRKPLAPLPEIPASQELGMWIVRLAAGITVATRPSGRAVWPRPVCRLLTDSRAPRSRR